MDGNVESNQDVSILKGKVSKIPQVDITLSKEGYAADAKATGDALAELKRQIDELASK
jgi:hypothetical protein